MSLRRMLLTIALVGACGDDGVRHLPDAPEVPDAPGAPGVSFTVDPPTISIASGGTVTVTATIVRMGTFTGDVVVSATNTPVDVMVTGGTIAADATSIPLTVVASPSAASKMFMFTATATADGLTIAPVDIAVRVAGRVGPPIGGEAAGDYFGSSLALSADGRRFVSGSILNDATGNEAGSVRVFERSGTTWVQVGGDLDGEAAGDRFGGAVAISNDGSRVAVGSFFNDGNGSTSGHARIFELVGTNWVQLGADIDGLAANYGLGFSVALSATGSRIVIGSPSAFDVNGRVYVYDLIGTTWTQVGAAVTGDHQCGHDVDISDDGNRIAVSSPSAQGIQYPGRVQAYELSGGVWVPLGAAIVGEGGIDSSGDSIALSADGSVLAIGASGNDGVGTNAGHVRVFRLAAGAWTQIGADLEGVTGTELGTSVSISADGTRVIAGGPSGAGGAYLYTLAGSTWTRHAAPDFGAGSRTGNSVAISADGLTAGVGAIYADAPGNNSGEVRLYDLP